MRGDNGNVMQQLVIAKARIEQLHSIALALRDWIDAVPKDVALPAMPGVDRDWVDMALNDANDALTVSGLSASEIIKILPKLNQRQDSTAAQLNDLYAAGVKLGLYDACDVIKMRGGR